MTVRAGELGEVPGAVSLAAYRVVQEALTNVVKHACGSRVTVDVGASGGAVLVTVEDYALRRRRRPEPVIRPASRRAGGQAALAWPGCGNGWPVSAVS